MRTFTTTLLALFLMGPSGSPSARAAETSSPLAAPRVDGKPVEVAIGFYALDFARVTAREESFDMTGYLELSWRDPRITPPPDPKGMKPIDAARTWTPRIFFENALEQPRYNDAPVVEIDGTGKITSWAIVSCKFSAPMSLQRFPFDQQSLTVRIGAFEDSALVTFVPNRDLIQVDDDAFLSDWTIGAATARVGFRRYVPGQEPYARYVYQVTVKRHWTFYVWRVMFPLTLLALVSWAAFWFEPVGLQPQISTCMASLIALVAFNFAIDFSLPKVTYLTLIDKHALIGISFVITAVAAVTLIHLAVDRQRVDQARRIQRIARWTLLPAYIMAVVLNLASAS